MSKQWLLIQTNTLWFILRSTFHCEAQCSVRCKHFRVTGVCELKSVLCCTDRLERNNQCHFIYIRIARCIYHFDISPAGRHKTPQKAIWKQHSDRTMCTWRESYIVPSEISPLFLATAPSAATFSEMHKERLPPFSLYAKISPLLRFASWP